MHLTNSLKKRNVILAVICANMSNFAIGTSIGWSSPILPKLSQHLSDSPLAEAITSAQVGWISSISTIGGIFTSLVAGQLGGKIGKKLVLLIGGILIEASYLILLFATDVWMLYAGRFLQGVAGGLICATVPMYIGEISTNDIRGAMGSLITLFMVGGIIYAYSIGPFVSYATLQICCLAVPLVFIASFAFMPETPYYLAKNNREEDLKKSLTFLRLTNEKEIEEEMNQIQKTVSEDATKNSSFLEIFRQRGYVKALIVCCGLLMFAQLSGITAVTFNSQSIFETANSTLDPAVATIILALTQFVSNLLTPFVIETIGRKVILLVSALGMSSSLFALGIFFYVQTFGDITPLMWIPVPALILFNISYAFGFGPVPMALLGEMFPSNVKPAAASIASTLSSLTTFIVTRWFPELNALGPYYAFFMFGVLVTISIFFVLFYVIETKGLSLEKIQEKLSS